MPQKLRKTRRYRGSRVNGYGRVGQHRKTSKKGHRNVGRHKHLWSYVIKYEPEYFGRRGFTPTRSLKREVNAINIGELEELANKLKEEKKEGKVFLDLDKLGYNKLLGMGKITKPVVVKVNSSSEAATKKIEEAGGKILKEEN
jgi:large subunit ribosomal protein L15